MATIEARLQALESKVNKTDNSMKVFICEGSEPTPDEQKLIDAMGDEKLMIVVFGRSVQNQSNQKGDNNG